MTHSTQSIVSQHRCMPTTTTLYDTIYTVHRLPRRMYADNYYTLWHNLHSPSSPETDVCLQLLHFMTQSTQSIVSRDRCMPTTTTLYDTIYTVHRLQRQMYADNYYTLWHILHSLSSPKTDVCLQLLHFMTQCTQSIVSRDGCMPTTTTLYDTIYTVHRSPETDVCRQLLHFMTQSTQSIVSRDGCMPTTTTLYDTIYTVHRLPRRMYADNYYTLWHNLHSPSSPETDVCRQLLHFMTQSTQSIVSRDGCMPTTTTLYDTIYTVHRLPRRMYAYNYYTLWHNLHSPSSPETDVCRQLLHFMTQSTQSIVSRDGCMPTTTTLYDTIYTVHRLPRRMYAYNYYTLWHNLHSPSSPETDVCRQLLHFMTQSTQSIVSRDRCMPTTTTLYDTIYTVHRLPRQMYADNYYTLWHILHSPSSPKTVWLQLLHFMTQSTQSIVSRDRCMPTTTTLYDTIYTVHRLPRQMYNYYTLWPTTIVSDTFMTQSTQSIVSRDGCMPTTTTLYDTIYTVHRLPRRMYAYNYYTLWHNLHSPSSPETDVCRQLLHFMTQSTQSIVSRDGCMPTTTTLYDTIYTVHRLPRRMYAYNYYTLWHNLHSPSSPETDVCLQLLHFMTQSTQSIVSRDGCMPTTTTLYDTIYTVHRLPRRMYADNYYTLWHNLHSPSSPETDVCLQLLHFMTQSTQSMSPETDVCRQLLHFMTQSTQSIVSRDGCMPTTTTLYDTIYTVHRLPRRMYADNYYNLWHNLHSPSSPETDVCLQLLHWHNLHSPSSPETDVCRQLLHFMTQSTQSIFSRDICMPTTTTLYDTIYTVHRLPRRDVCLQLLHFMTQSTQSIVSRDRCMPTTTTLYDTIYTVHRLPDNYYIL